MDINPACEVIAIAPGPSFHEFLASNKNDLDRLPTVGCSRVPKYYDNLTHYCYGDSLHEPNIPKNPKTTIWSRDRIWRPGDEHWSIYWPDCGSTGGMAVTLACMKYTHIGLVGFDGRMNEFGELLPREYIIHFTSAILDHWSAQGKFFYNLMGESIYSGRLI